MSGQKSTVISFFNKFLCDVFIFILIHVLHIYNFYCIICRRANSFNL